MSSGGIAAISSGLPAENSEGVHTNYLQRRAMDGKTSLTRMTDDARSSGFKGQGEPLSRYSIGSSVDGEICRVVLA